jgi:sulfate transport system ATP-binding protein
MTTILVTHDQEEALEVSDRVVVMNRAKIEQVGTPSEVFHSPASEFVMDFLGNVNVFHGRVEQGKTVLGAAVAEKPDAKSNGQPKVYVRPHELEISRESQNGSSLAARVLRMNPAGSFAKVELALLHGGEVQVDLPFERYLELGLQVGEEVNVSPRRVRMFVPEYVI